MGPDAADAATTCRRSPARVASGPSPPEPPGTSPLVRWIRSFRARPGTLRRIALAILTVALALIVQASAAAGDDDPDEDDARERAHGAPRPSPTQTPPSQRQLFHLSLSDLVPDGSSWIRDWLAQPYMLGNLGGLREALGRFGITPSATFVTDVQGNPIGGERQALREFDNLGVDLSVDLEKLLGAPGTKFRVSVSNRSGTNLSEIDIGNTFNVSQLCCGATIRLVDVSLEQPLWDDRLNLRAGRIAAGDEFMTSPLYWLFVSNGIDGNPGAISNNAPGMTVYPVATWGLRARALPLSSLYVTAGVYNGDPTLGENDKHGVDWSMRGPLFAIAEIGYMLNQEKGATGLPGNYKIGAYYNGGTYEDFLRDSSGGLAPLTGQPPRTVRGKTGFYVLADQVLYREGAAQSLRGLSAFAGLLIASAPSIDPIPLFVDGGLVYRGLIPGRGDDVAGFGVLYGRFSDDLARAQRLAGQPAQSYEMVLEWTYAIAVTKWLSVQPDVQYIIRPGGTGTIPNALVVGFQLGVTF